MHRVYIWAVNHFLTAYGLAVCPAVLIVWGVRSETSADWRVSVCIGSVRAGMKVRLGWCHGAGTAGTDRWRRWNMLGALDGGCGLVLV